MAAPGDENLYAIFDLVMGVKGWGTSTRFILDDLSSRIKQRILDLSLRLLDYCRFEILRRLNWVEGFKEATLPLLSLVDLVDAAPAQKAAPAPALAPSHPAYPEYEKLIPGERHTFIRRLIPAALNEFRQRLEEDEGSG